MTAIFVCPRCRGHLTLLEPDKMECRPDKLIFPRENGIWRFLLPERAEYFQRFITEYSYVRQQEGRGSHESNFYRALPFKDLSGERSWEWAIRARSFSTLLDKIIVPREMNGILSILDLGAGNAWLSNRLAARGHWIAAVDLQTNTLDGLGASTHYTTSFVPVQAEFEYLPLADNQIDLVVFNASFHYSENYQTTLVAALAVCKPGGVVVILDTPIYNEPNSGEQMVLERQSLFKQKYGTYSNTLSSGNFLSHSQISELAIVTDSKLTLLHPRYPLGWRIRQSWVKLRGGREPAKFSLLIFEKN